MGALLLSVVALLLIQLPFAGPAAGSVDTGRVVARGDNGLGRASPPSDGDFVTVAAGRCFGLGLRSDGSIAAWGAYSSGSIRPPAEKDFKAASAGGRGVVPEIDRPEFIIGHRLP